jgi:glycerophosphoryl diester phosphodiesterase
VTAFTVIQGRSTVFGRSILTAWAWSIDGAKKCSKDYVLKGWTGIIPRGCRKRHDHHFDQLSAALLGLAEPADQADGQCGCAGDRDRTVRGTTGDGPHLPEQLGKMPSSFKGYIWVDDIWTWARAPAEPRHPDQGAAEAAEAGLKRRRQATN